MADKSFEIRQGSDVMRPKTNEKCVLASGFGNVKNALNSHVAVPVGILAVGNINTGTSRYSSTAVSGKTTSIVMKEPFLIPYVGVTFKVTIDKSLEGLTVLIYYGYNEGMTSTTSNVSKYVTSVMVNGSEFTFPIDYNEITNGYDKTHWYYRIGFFSSTLTLTVQDINEYFRLGYISITCVENCPDVVQRNIKATEVIEASKTPQFPTKHRNFVFTHISDTHANGIALLNALKYSESVNSQGLFITGDVVAQSSYDGYGYVHEMSKDFSFPSFLTSGNHDGVGISSLTTFNNGFFGDMSTTFGYTRQTGVGYYYKDLATSKIRIIALDSCDTSASYRINSVGSTQLSWLSTTLGSVPSGYGVIIILHQPVGNITAASRAAHPSFATYPDLPSNEINWTGASGIKSAVDSFIEDGGEFIMYAVGHEHVDLVGLVSGTTHKQIQAIVSSPNGMQDMQHDFCSLGDGIGNAKDLFNAYVIDRTYKTIRVVRVGANISNNLYSRLFEEYSYDDSTDDVCIAHNPSITYESRTTTLIIS